MRGASSNTLAGLFAILGGLVFACVLGLHMYNQAAAKNQRIDHYNGPRLHGTIVAMSKPHTQTYASPGVWGGTGFDTEQQTAATLRYRTPAGRTKTVRISPANGLKLHEKFNFYDKPGGDITTESGKEPPKSIWMNIVVEGGLLGVIVGLLVGLFSVVILDALQRRRPIVRVAG